MLVSAGIRLLNGVNYTPGMEIKDQHLIPAHLMKSFFEFGYFIDVSNEVAQRMRDEYDVKLHNDKIKTLEKLTSEALLRRDKAHLRQLNLENEALRAKKDLDQAEHEYKELEAKLKDMLKPAHCLEADTPKETEAVIVLAASESLPVEDVQPKIEIKEIPAKKAPKKGRFKRE